MSFATLERTESLQAHPNITTAARILGISPSTVSRRKDLEREGRGEREKVLSPTDVLRLAVRYRKRSLNEVALALIEHARTHAPAEVASVEAEIERFVEAMEAPDRGNEAFLAMAKELLPAKLYAEVERTVNTDRGQRPRSVVGYRPKAAT